MTSLSIRPAKPSDYQAIADIYNESIAVGRSTMDIHPVGPDKFEHMHHGLGEREVLLVAETNRTVGWGAIRKYSDRYGYRVCCETSIYLTLTEVSKGYGSQLQAELIQRLTAFQYRHVVAKIMAINLESIQFHRKFGFEMVGIQKEIGYFNDRWHDVAIMQLLVPDVAPPDQ